MPEQGKPYEQEKRVGKLTIAGGTPLNLVNFSGSEAISEPFVFRAEGVSVDKDNIDFDKVIGLNATVTINTTGDGKRFFTGLVTETSHAGTSAAGFHYSLVLRPRLHLLKKRTNSRIFKGDNVNTILNKILKTDWGMPFQDKCTRGYPNLEYCVQHRETDFDFVSRLMEAHGIAYHFEFTETDHKMIIADTSREDMPGKAGKKRKFVYGDEAMREDEAIFTLSGERTLTTGKVFVNDYYFEKPTQDLEKEKESDAKYEHKHIEHYSPTYNTHLNNATEPSRGEKFAEWRLQSFRSEDNHFVVTGDSPGLTPGYLMTLEDHDFAGGDYVVIRANHEFSDQSYRSGVGGGAMYSGSYTLFPDTSGKPYAPPVVTPRPFVGGVETAVVVNEKDAASPEIDVDDYERILVRFHWEKRSDKERSMRARIGTMWAGNGWGTIWTPRVGMEVLVVYADGDPDRPIVIGSVYNFDNKVPYKQGGTTKNISGIKSKSTEKASGYNEFVFDDTAGKELIRMHAQFDRETLIENDERREVKRDRNTTVKNKETLIVTDEALFESKKKITIKVGASTIVMDEQSITIKSPTVTVHGTTALTTKSDIGATHSATGLMTITGGTVKIN